MKIAVLGGYGVFGSRLADLLMRDGHDVIVVGRNQAAAQACATKIGAVSLAMDRAGDLAPLWALQPDVVVDCAGPFHAYGDDPYRFAKAAIRAGVHYLDLADDAAFCAGIATLDDDAKAAGVFVLSGMSSVPALSSAVVAALTEGVDAVDHIETAILPGNRAPRGQAVVDSILYQAGTDISVTIDGQSEDVRSWSRSQLFDLPQGIRRRGYMIRVPDQSLFPTAFQARSVTFYAGLEVGVMNFGLAVFAWVRKILGFGVPDWFGRTVRWAAERMHGLGTNVGGMSVRVICHNAGQWEARSWRLLVREGEGPYVPAISARTVLRNPELVAAGARAGLCVFNLSDAEAALSDLAAVTETDSTPLKALFLQVVGPAFHELPAAVQESHQTFGPRRLVGTARITRGTGLWPALIAGIFGFPKAAETMPVTVIKTPVAAGEIWERRFGDQIFKSKLSAGPDGMQESFGPFTFDLGLKVQDGALHFPIKRGRFWGVPLPSIMLPQSEARETEEAGRFNFDVALKAPLTGQLIVRYQGILERYGDLPS